MQLLIFLYFYLHIWKQFSFKTSPLALSFNHGFFCLFFFNHLHYLIIPPPTIIILPTIEKAKFLSFIINKGCIHLRSDLLFLLVHTQPIYLQGLFHFSCSLNFFKLKSHYLTSLSFPFIPPLTYSYIKR